MWKILRYSFFDLIRNRWTLVYTGFYLLLTIALLWLSGDLSKVIISLTNVVLLLVPLVATMFGVTYSYSTREFSQLLLSQPIKRSSVFLGQYLGVASSLGLSLLLGIGIPFVMYGILGSTDIWNYWTLILMGICLSFSFSGIAFWIALKQENRVKGFGMAIGVWLFFAVIYDGLLLMALAWFSDYPLETFAVGASVFNPIDLSRITLLLKLDISAMMGYTGAVFQAFFGSGYGILISLTALSAWIFVPIMGIKRMALRKDF